MEKKLVFFDIDGTIISEKTHTIPESTIKAIRRLRENGHYAFINTGRCESLIGEELKEGIGFDGYLLGCGTSIIFQGKNLLHQSLSKELISELNLALRNDKIDAVFEGEKADYRASFDQIHSPYFADMLRKSKINYKTLEEPDMEADKLFIYTTRESDFTRFQEQFAERLDFIDRENGFYEVLPSGFSKASGIAYLLTHLGSEQKDTIAIGDSNNDLSMLSFVHTSIAMERSSKEVLSMADYVTSDVDADGILNALSWLKLI